MGIKLDTEFGVETADRAIKSFFQGLVVYAGGSDAVLNAWEFNWAEALGASLGLAVLSVATSFASGSIFKKAATPASVLPPPPIPE